ncbi:hypothetical protein RB595_008389 [Gaeumannomyces hyphopodioides]
MLPTALLALASLATASVIQRQAGQASPPRLDGDPARLKDACSEVAGKQASIWGWDPEFASTEPGNQWQVVPPSIALACLQSVEVDVENDVALLDYLMPIVDWQSTIGYHKNPPAGYLIPGLDIPGGMAEMRKKLLDKRYKNQFQFVMELKNFFLAAGDFHFTYQPGLLEAFGFLRGMKLVSVSTDGVQLPKVYDGADLLKSRVQGGYKASAIVEMDGQKIEDAMVRWSPSLETHDPDTRYNGHFVSYNRQVVWANEPLHDSHEVRFGNGSTRTYYNWALPSANVSDAATGEDMHAMFELPGTAVSNFGLSERIPDLLIGGSSDPPTLPTGLPPNPFAIHTDGYMFGYLLNSTVHRDVCVLVIQSFTAKDPTLPTVEQLINTQAFIRSFLEGCRDSESKRLVIDVHDNGGGILYAGHDIYRHLFPKNDNWSGHRVRSTAYFRYLSTVVPKDGNGLFDGIVQPNGSDFRSFLSFLGPSKDVSQDTVSELSVWNFSDPRAAADSELSRDFLVAGYDANDTGAPKEALFKPEDIVIATNGFCGSTCATFLRLMTVEAGVRTVAFGGRPREAPMQAVGTSKGSNIRKSSHLAHLSKVFANYTEGTAPPADALVMPGTPPPLQPLGEGMGQINFRNSYNPGAPGDAPPTQFIYEAAHCRRFFRAEAVIDAAAMWQDAADVAWNGARCVNGSTVNSGGTIGRGGRFNAGTLPYTDGARDLVAYTGPGSVNGGVAPSGKPPASAGGPGKDGTSAKEEEEAEKKKEQEKKNAAGAIRAPGPVVMAALVVGAVMASVI